MTKKKVLFIDRDGTLIVEPPEDYQVDSLEKLSFMPGVFSYLSRIAQELDYELVMVTNQDGLGTESFPENDFWPAQNKMLEAFKNENINFEAIHIDRSFAQEQQNTRKPGTGLLKKYFSTEYDLANSLVIGDRLTDVALAKNLGAKAIYFSPNPQVTDPTIVLQTQSWKDIYTYLKYGLRKVHIYRKTKETEIDLSLNLDGKGQYFIDTGIKFFDHMLEQIAKHAQIDMVLKAKGDLEVDEHHTIEDVGLVLGEAIKKSLSNKKGLNRYGFILPMDNSLAQVSLDLGGRNWIVWKANFKREKIGQMPTEMFYHFFKSLSDTCRCNLNIQADGYNEHHKIEAIFKAFAKALYIAKQRNIHSDNLPSTKAYL